MPRDAYPGQALSVALYLEGGIRGVELGSVAFAHADPFSGEMVYPAMELVRLAIPRRTYTQAHFDYIIETFKAIYTRREELRGFRFTYAPQIAATFHLALRNARIIEIEPGIVYHRKDYLECRSCPWNRTALCA